MTNEKIRSTVLYVWLKKHKNGQTVQYSILLLALFLLIGHRGGAKS